MLCQKACFVIKCFEKTLFFIFNIKLQHTTLGQQNSPREIAFVGFSDIQAIRLIQALHQLKDLP